MPNSVAVSPSPPPSGEATASALDFVAIDVETANRSPASICAIGLVRVRSGRVAERASWLVQPPRGHDEFAPFNVQLHGISRERCSVADTWPAQRERLLEFIGNDVLVAHNSPFDLGVLAATHLAAGESSDMPPLPVLRHFCSLRLARRVYDLPRYRLPVAAAAAGFTNLQHHDPLSDAEAAAAIVIDGATRLGARTMGELAQVSGVAIRVADVHGDPAATEELIARATF